MKRPAALLCAILLCLACAAGADGAGEAAPLAEKYEAPVVLPALDVFLKVGMDQVSKFGCQQTVKYGSAAWELITHFDSGWFPKMKDFRIRDARTDNWTGDGEGAFECDVYAVNHVAFLAENVTVDYPVAYHFRFENTVPGKREWRITDFWNLPDPQAQARAERLTEELDGISVESVTGKSFLGYMFIVDDPSRIICGTTDYFSREIPGWRLDRFADKYGGTVVFNGGAFEDGKGKNAGAVPAGYLVSQGTVKSYNQYKNSGCNIVMGFDAQDRLHVGRFTDAQLQEMQLRDAMSFQPALVQDGKTGTFDPKYRGFSARTGIGQDGDGRVCILIVQGRQPNSLGASFDDMAEVFASYGAVNAGNLDGGNSTAVMAKGESVYSAYPMSVSRRMPAAFIVK